MAKIAFVILAHESAGPLAELARLLTGWSETAHVIIHYDLNSPAAEFEKLRQAFPSGGRVHLVEDRLRCGWGDFSLVEASLRGLRKIRELGLDCERVMLLSGACMPIRPLAELSEFLDRNPGRQFIEINESDWIVGGMRDDRWRYRHVVNQRKHTTTFRNLLRLQKMFGLKRRFPEGFTPKFGSQWWTLTWDLCRDILDLLDARPEVYRFFRTTWIPDEMMFQTFVHHLSKPEDLAGHGLTFYEFNEYGMPFVFNERHLGMIEAIPRFFARKIEPSATGLMEKLAAIANCPAPAGPIPALPPTYRLPVPEIAAEQARLEPGHTRLFARQPHQLLTGDPDRQGSGARKKGGVLASLKLAWFWYRRGVEELFFTTSVRKSLDRTAAIRRGDILLLGCAAAWDDSIHGFCDYYRRLGVKHFLFIEHGEAQDCARLVGSAGDITVFSASGPIEKADDGYAWRNTVLRRHGVGHFTVLADPGEYLVYPFIETRSLGEFAGFMRNERKDSLHGVVIDAYASAPGATPDARDPFAAPFAYDGLGYTETDRGDLTASVTGGPSMRFLADAERKNAPDITRVIGVWWKWNYRFTDKGRAMRPPKLMRVYASRTPIFNAALMRFPQAEAARGLSAEELAGRYGKAVAAAAASGRDFHAGDLSTRWRSSKALVSEGIISAGHWI